MARVQARSLRLVVGTITAELGCCVSLAQLGKANRCVEEMHQRNIAMRPTPVHRCGVWHRPVKLSTSCAPIVPFSLRRMRACASSKALRLCNLTNSFNTRVPADFNFVSFDGCST